MKKQAGFTLIELMIVVAIVAILAAIALPAYQTYTKKSKMTQLVAATGALKTAVEVCSQSYGVTNCALSANGMPANEGDYAAVDLTYTAGTSGGSVTIEAKPTASGASGTLAPLTVNDTVTIAASAAVPLIWKITCNADATDNGYCPN